MKDMKFKNTQFEYSYIRNIYIYLYFKKTLFSINFKYIIVTSRQ